MPTPALQQAVRIQGNAARLGGEQLANAYMAQAMMAPQVAAMNANIAASYQQPQQSSGGSMEELLAQLGG
jgi:hypothetical protein